MPSSPSADGSKMGRRASCSLRGTYGMVERNIALSMIKGDWGLSGRKLDGWGRSSVDKSEEFAWRWLRGRLYATVLS